jgi:hypothetical protein
MLGKEVVGVTHRYAAASEYRSVPRSALILDR